MTVGNKIKKFRLRAGLSQLELARKVGISEPALRNYELGNRNPSEKQIEHIATALDISPFAISEPNLDINHGLIQALFYLEDYFQLQIHMDHNHPVLQFSQRFPDAKLSQQYLETVHANAVNDMLKYWFKEKTALEEGRITKEEYDYWRYSYPKVLAQRTHDAISAPLSTEETQHGDKPKADINEAE